MIMALCIYVYVYYCRIYLLDAEVFGLVTTKIIKHIPGRSFKKTKISYPFMNVRMSLTSIISIYTRYCLCPALVSTYTSLQSKMFYSMA